MVSASNQTGLVRSYMICPAANGGGYNAQRAIARSSSTVLRRLLKINVQARRQGNCCVTVMPINTGETSHRDVSTKITVVESIGSFAGPKDFLEERLHCLP